MSYLYDNPQEQANLSDTLDRIPQVPSSPGFFQNFWGATGAGLARGGLKLAEVGTYFSHPDSLMAQQMMEGFMGDTTDYVKKDQEARAAARVMLAQKAMDLAPNPLITGTGSKIASQFAEVVPTAIAGSVAGPFGAAALVGSAQGVGDYQESVLLGIDPETAAKKALLTGSTAGAGVVIPMAKTGASLLTNLVIGSGVNVVSGSIQRGGTAAILDAAGYHDQAAQYKVLDADAILIDTIMGAAFGGIGHYLGRTTTEQVDAALKLNERQHIEIEGQPGIHKTAESRQAGVQSFEDTLNGLLTDDKAPDVTARAASIDIETNPKVVQDYHEAKAALEEELPGLADFVNQYPKQEEVSPIEFTTGANDFIAAKSEHGMVSGHVRDGELHITHAEVSEAMRGTGEGTRLYKALIDKALGQGLRVFSDSTVEAAAVRVYKSLEKQGYKVNDLTVGTLEDGAKYGEGASKPVFEVTREPDAASATTPKSQASNPAKGPTLSPMRAEQERQILDQHPDIMVRDEDGNTATATELLQRADANIEAARKDAGLYDVAVACFLGGFS